jgi:tellurite resistance protein TerC
LDVSAGLWLASIGGILAVIVIDFVTHVRRPHVPTLRESATWIGIYVSLAVLFGLAMGLAAGWDFAGQYFAGYLTEESLSLDNLFVFLIIIGRSRVPREAEQRVLLVGIALALVLRGAFIALGAAVIEHFSAVFYLFGAFLIYTAWTQVRGGGHEPSAAKDPLLVRWARKVIPSTPDFMSDRVFARADGRRMVTPLFFVMVAIGGTDILFAMDSIPAVFGLTKEPYIVFMANAFALLGLRQLYFLIGGLLQRLPHLSTGLAVILAYIGVKLVLEALHANELPFINHGESVPVWQPPTWLSLTVIVGVMAVVVAASRLPRRRRLGEDPPGE